MRWPRRHICARLDAGCPYGAMPDFSGTACNEGSAARAFVQIQVTSDRFVEAGRQFLTGDHDDAETLVFESRTT